MSLHLFFQFEIGLIGRATQVSLDEKQGCLMVRITNSQKNLARFRFRLKLGWPR